MYALIILLATCTFLFRYWQISLLTLVDVIHRRKLGNMRRLDGILALHLEAISRLKFQMRVGWYECAVCVWRDFVCLVPFYCTRWRDVDMGCVR